MARASSEEPFDHFQAIALAGPDEGFVEDLLRIRRGLPVREAAVRTVEAAGSRGIGCQGSIGAEADLDQRREAEPGGGAEIVRSDSIATQEVGDLAMPPEERDNQRGAAGTVGFRVQGGTVFDQKGGELTAVAIDGLMERRPPAIVRLIDVGARLQEALRGRWAAFPFWFAGEADREIEQGVAIWTSLAGEAGIDARQRGKAVRIARAQGDEGAQEWFGRCGGGICGQNFYSLR